MRGEALVLEVPPRSLLPSLSPIVIAPNCVNGILCWQQPLAWDHGQSSKQTIAAGNAGTDLNQPMFSVHDFPAQSDFSAQPCFPAPIWLNLSYYWRSECTAPVFDMAYFYFVKTCLWTQFDALALHHARFEARQVCIVKDRKLFKNLG
jgi:hypothetical protein